MFGFGWAEIVVLALLFSVVFVVFVVYLITRPTKVPAKKIDQATEQRLRDKIEDLRTENDRLREEIERLQERTPSASPIPSETGIKHSEP